MEIQFQEFKGTAYALSPRIERSAGQMALTFEQKACSHFLIFSHSPEVAVNLRDPGLQERLRAMGRALLEAENTPLTEELLVSCVRYQTYLMRDCMLQIPSRIAGYTVFGCRLLKQREPELFNIILPQGYMSCSVNVSVTVPYRTGFCSDGGGPRGGRAFYTVQFEDVPDLPDYQDGGIVYILEDLPFRFPVTKEMLGGQRLYIEAGRGEPVFQTVVSGLKLKKI